MRKNTGKTIGYIAVVILIIVVAVIAIARSANIGDVTGKPYSVKLTSPLTFGPGTWVYYDDDGQEQPLNCERFFNITCESENGDIEFSVTVGKNNTLSFPHIKVNGEDQNIDCIYRGFSADCLTTMK